MQKDYKNVKINGVAVEAQKTFNETSQTYQLNLGKITKELYYDDGNPNEYVITFDVDTDSSLRSSATLGAIKLTQDATKTMTMLTISMMDMSGAELTDSYTYSSQNISGYQYILEQTDSSYEASFDESEKVSDANGGFEKPSAGYYAVKVTAISNNQNVYLN